MRERRDVRNTADMSRAGRHCTPPIIGLQQSGLRSVVTFRHSLLLPHRVQQQCPRRQCRMWDTRCSIAREYGLPSGPMRIQRVYNDKPRTYPHSHIASASLFWTDSVSGGYVGYHGRMSLPPFSQRTLLRHRGPHVSDRVTPRVALLQYVREADAPQ